MSEIKVGDKLFCIKNNFNLKKGNYYKVHSIHFLGCIDIISNKLKIYWFHLEKNDKHYIYNYFLSKKEERKLKLEKIKY